MKTIFEITGDSFSLKEETLKINYAFENAKTMGEFSPTFTIKEYIDRFLFIQWNHRGLCFTIDEFLKVIAKNIKDKNNFHEMFDFLYIEFIYNMIELLNMKDESIFDHNKIGEAILNNINIILEKTCREIHETDDFKYIIIDKDPNIVAVSNVLQTNSKVQPVLEYTHLMTQGDLRLKKSLLIEMAHDFEPKRTRLESKGNQFTTLASRLGEMLNVLNLRHNTIEGNLELPKVANMPPEELEVWYDRTYKLYLLAVLAFDFDDSRNEIKTFLEEIRKK